MRRVRLVGFRLRLNRFDVLDEVLDPLLVHLVAAVEPLENRSPHMHVARAVRGGREALLSLEDTLHARRRERATIPLRKRRQVRWWHLQRRRHASVALAVAAVARRAVELEQVLARD